MALCPLHIQSLKGLDRTLKLELKIREFKLVEMIKHVGTVSLLYKSSVTDSPTHQQSQKRKLILGWQRRNTVLVWHLVFLLESLQMGTLQPEAAESRLKNGCFCT